MAKEKTNFPRKTKSSASAAGVPVHCRHDRLQDPRELQPHPKNPNRHPAAQIEIIARVLKHHGWRLPIIVSSRSGFITRGHGRQLAALHNAWPSVPVEVQDYASEQDEIADMLADNQLPELATIDKSELAKTLSELNATGFDLALAGFQPMQVDELLALLQPSDLKDLAILAPPKLTWVLIGIPTIRFGEVSALVEAAAALPDTICETTVTDELDDQDRQRKPRR